jgi:hypothetical protein
MRTRPIAAALVLALLTGCQPGTQPPNTAAPQPAARSSPAASIALPPPEHAPNYDAAVEPVDETRTPQKVAAKTVISKATAQQAAERTRRENEAAKKEKAAPAKASSTASVESPPAVPAPTSSLSMPPGGGTSPLPKPVRDGRKPEAARLASYAAMPPSMERPELPKAAAVEPTKPASVPAPAPTAPTSPEPAQRAEPTPGPPPSAPSPPTVGRAEPKIASAPPVEAPSRRPPSGPPLGTVPFAPRSAELSDGMRAALAFFARDANAQGVRQVELWASASDDDPVVARKTALARALAVHAFLTDVGLKARVAVGGYTESHEGGGDRVDLVVPKR